MLPHQLLTWKTFPRHHQSQDNSQDKTLGCCFVSNLRFWLWLRQGERWQVQRERIQGCNLIFYPETNNPLTLIGPLRCSKGLWLVESWEALPHTTSLSTWQLSLHQLRMKLSEIMRPVPLIGLICDHRGLWLADTLFKLIGVSVLTSGKYQQYLKVKYNNNVGWKEVFFIDDWSLEQTLVSSTTYKMSFPIFKFNKIFLQFLINATASGFVESVQIGE